MIRTTPFHSRLAALDKTGLWSHWAGHLTCDKYQMSEKTEYLAIRNSVGLFDTSPLYKYRIAGPDAIDFLGRVLTRDPTDLSPGRSQYTLWCDDDGYVLEDGVLMCLGSDEFFLSTARPNLGYLRDLVGADDVTVADLSDKFGALAVVGPSSRRLLSELTKEVAALKYFDVTTTTIHGVEVLVSRTGFTGDLGYEIWVKRAAAETIWDAAYGVAGELGGMPIGQTAVLMARIEAGLVLIDVDFKSSRFAWTANDRVTPHELGLGWMVDRSDRSYVGSRAIREQIGSERWLLTGLAVDPYDWDRLHRAAGVPTAKEHVPVDADLMVYGPDENPVGWTSSFMYSPMLQRHIALARVGTSLARPGAVVHLEVAIDHEYRTVRCEVTRPPFYDPPQRTA